MQGYQERVLFAPHRGSAVIAGSQVTTMYKAKYLCLSDTIISKHNCIFKCSIKLVTDPHFPLSSMTVVDFKVIKTVLW